MATEERREHSELEPAEKKFGIVNRIAAVIHVPTYVMSPISVAHVGCSGGEIRLEGERGVVDESVAGKTDLVTVAAESAPAVEDHRTAVGTVFLHVIEENMVAPESLSETIGVGAGEVLLPVKPPEVNALFLERTQEVVCECLVEICIFEFPWNHFSGVGIQSHVRCHAQEDVFR